MRPSDILKFQIELLKLAIQAERLKEYEADWLTNVKKVVRDSSGKFASKASGAASTATTKLRDVAESTEEKVSNLKNTVKDIAENPEEAKRKVNSKLVKLAGIGLEKVTTKSPVFADELLDRAFGVDAQEARDKLADKYGELNPGLPNAIKPDPFKELADDLRQKDRDPEEVKKDLIRALEFAGYSYNKLLDDLNNIEDQPEAVKVLGKLAAAAIPVSMLLAVAIGPDLAIGAILGEGLAETLAGAAGSQAASYAAGKAMDKLDVEDPKTRIAFDLVASVAGGVTMVKGMDVLAKRGLMPKAKVRQTKDLASDTPGKTSLPKQPKSSNPLQELSDDFDATYESMDFDTMLEKSTKYNEAAQPHLVKNKQKSNTAFTKESNEDIKNDPVTQMKINRLLMENPSVKEDEAISLAAYTASPFYKMMNGILRGQLKSPPDGFPLGDHINEMIKNADKALKKLPKFEGSISTPDGIVSSNGQLNRYVEYSDDILAKYQIGKNITEASFTSTTIVKEPLGGHMAQFGGNTIIRIKHKPKSNARYIDNINMTMRVQEVTYPPGQKFRVANKKQEMVQVVAGDKPQMVNIIELVEI